MRMLEPGDPEYQEVMNLLAGVGLPAVCPTHREPFRIVAIDVTDMLLPPEAAPHGAPPRFHGIL